MLLIRIPYYIWGESIFVEIFQYLLIGEKVSSDIWMYSDIMSEIPPFAAYFYSFLSLLFGRDLWIHHFLGYFVGVLMVILFNNLVNNNRANVIQSAVPGLMLGILLSISPSTYTLTPVMICMSFILLVINFQFRHLEFKTKRDEKILNIGLYLGLAILFFTPAVYFIIATFLILAIYSRTIFRRYLMILFGAFLPLFFLFAAYILFKDPVDLFNYLISYEWYGAELSFHWNGTLIFLFSALIIGIASVIMVGRFTNYQTALNQAMFIWLLFGFGIYWVYNLNNPGAVIILIPPIAFYLSQLFTLVPKGRWAIILGVLLFTGSFYVNVLSWKGTGEDQSNFENNPYSEITKGKRILALESGWFWYYNAYHATSLFNFDLVKPVFEAAPDYNRIVTINGYLSADLPEVILDPNRYLEPYMEYMPDLQKKYQLHENPFYWERISN